MRSLLTVSRLTKNQSGGNDQGRELDICPVVDISSSTHNTSVRVLLFHSRALHRQSSMTDETAPSMPQRGRYAAAVYVMVFRYETKKIREERSTHHTLVTLSRSLGQAVISEAKNHTVKSPNFGFATLLPCLFCQILIGDVPPKIDWSPCT